MGEVIVIANPNAGDGGGPERARALVDRLRRPGVDCRLHVTRSLEDATHTAQWAAGAETVVAVGGDGTVGASIEGLMRVPAASRPRLALLASGSNADGADEDAAALVSAIVSSAPREVDVGYLPDRDRYFASTVVLRGMSEALREAAPQTSLRWKTLAHRASDLPPPFADARTIEMTLSTDHRREQLRVHALVIANPALLEIGGPGQLEIIALHGSTPPDLPHRVWSLVRGMPPPSGATRHLVRDASLQTSEPMAVAIDGEPGGGTPVTVRLMPKAIRLFVPAARAERSIGEAGPKDVTRGNHTAHGA